MSLLPIRFALYNPGRHRRFGGGEGEVRDYFRELGRRIEVAWARADRDEDRFAEIAAAELDRLPPLDHLSAAGLAAGLLEKDEESPGQFAPPGAFGEPGLTLFHGREFLIDVYFWNHALPAIHNHPFRGCFTILEGFSLSDDYEFTPAERLGARVQIGTITPTRVALLRPGAVVPFDALIHALVHVPNPTVSMVVRTIRTEGYYRYLPPMIAISVYEPDDLTVRQLALLDWMRRCGAADYVDRASAFIARSDFETAFRVISAAYGDPAFEPLLDAARQRHGERAALIRPSIEEAQRRSRENDAREQFTGDRDRLAASILMCAHHREEALGLLAEGFPSGDGLDVLRSFARPDADPEEAAEFERLVRGEPVGEGWEETMFRALLP